MQELVGSPLLDHVAEEGRKKQPESKESKDGADPVKITVEVPFLFNLAGISGGLGCILTLIIAVHLKQLPLWPLKNISQYAAKYPGVSTGFCSLPTWPLDSHLIPWSCSTRNNRSGCSGSAAPCADSVQLRLATLDISSRQTVASLAGQLYFAESASQEQVSCPARRLVLI